MKVVLIDNYDSFVFNLAQYLGELGAHCEVIRNDAGADEVARRNPQAIVISPGPGRPENAGCCLEVIDRFAGDTPILGVCLGHQAIGLAYGGKVVNAPQVMHGKISKIHHRSQGVFRDLPNPFEATRYHSLVIEPGSVSTELAVTAETEDGVIMGLRHKSDFVEGVQFHPESIMTAPGLDLLNNFLMEIKTKGR